jgi:hypothetical protein
MRNFIGDNPAAVTAFCRAALGLAVAFYPNLFTPTQQEVILVFVAAALGLSVVTIKTTVPKAPSATATPASIQTPQPPA